MLVAPVMLVAVGSLNHETEVSYLLVVLDGLAQEAVEDHAAAPDLRRLAVLIELPAQSPFSMLLTTRKRHHDSLTNTC